MILIKRPILVAIPVMFLVANLVFAQDRLPPIPSESLTAEQAAAVAELVEMRGYGPQGPWRGTKAWPTDPVSRGQA